MIRDRFPGDPTITQDQEDFEYTVMHELVHGLGFTARLTTFFDEVDPTIVTPAPLFYTTGGFAGWEPPALFTAYIFTKSQDNAAELCRTIASFQPPRGTTETDFYPLFKASGAPYLAARQLYQAATSGYGGMYVYIPKDAMPPANGTAAYLYTGTQWRTGSSISHLAQEYASRSTADFLMAPAIIPGETLDGIVARTSPGWAYGAMGPRTLDIMNINGYSINMNPGGVVIPTETAGPTRTATATATAASVSTWVERMPAECSIDTDFHLDRSTSKPNGAAPKVVGGSFAAFAIALLAALL